MKFFRYWARGTASVVDGWNVHACGASDTSLEDARAQARRIAERTAAVFAAGDLPGDYDYLERPIREELVRTIGSSDAPTAVLTRNAYGAVVLNTSRVLFADLDLTAERPGCLGGLFGARGKSQDDAILERVRELSARDNRVGTRLYRTAAGYRCLVTHRTFEPSAPESLELLRRLGSDPLYVRMCELQECFRARLTPKPWRIELSRPPARFPWTTDDEEQAVRRWEEAYERASASFSTCALVASFGNPVAHPDVAPILALHDELACNGDRPLA